MSEWIRNTFYYLSQNKQLNKFANRHWTTFGTKKFIAGNSIEEAVVKMKQLRATGLSLTVVHLGEFVEDEHKVKQETLEVLHCMDVLAREALKAEISVKLTSLGLDISYQLALHNMRKILAYGQEKDITVMIDMEDYETSFDTLKLYIQLSKEYSNIGTVLQAHLYKTLQDLQKLSDSNPYLRLVKGAYLESEDVAFPTKENIDENYRNIIKLNLLYGNYTAIGTHDVDIIHFVKDLEETHCIPRTQFEFQMLYGVRQDLQKTLRQEGYKVRVYVPYGKERYGYQMRRLAERPANVFDFMKKLFKK